jgi:hypothetical protein
MARASDLDPRVCIIAALGAKDDTLQLAHGQNSSYLGTPWICGSANTFDRQIVQWYTDVHCPSWSKAIGMKVRTMIACLLTS